ncbi:MAG: hypothetical protein LWW85_09410 [Marinilabiliales bacterium]|nr:hypothetical protein [Marinilabiliales bacterium]
MKTAQKAIVLMGIVLTLLFSCQKSDLKSVLDEVLVSQQEMQTDEMLSDIDLIADEALAQNGTQLKSGTLVAGNYLTSCANVTVDTKSVPQSLVIDFGANCTGKDGKVRSGRILITSTSFSTFPSVRTKTFDNYVVDGKKLNGKIVKSIQQDFVNKIRTATLDQDVTITLPNQEGTAHHLASQTRQYYLNELGVQDDNVVKSWGTATFTRPSGIEVTRQVDATDPLIFSASCHHVISGKIIFTSSKDRTWTLDFGNGECDNKATLTINGKTKEITIR